MLELQAPVGQLAVHVIGLSPTTILCLSTFANAKPLQSTKNLVHSLCGKLCSSTDGRAGLTMLFIRDMTVCGSLMLASEASARRPVIQAVHAAEQLHQAFPSPTNNFTSLLCLGNVEHIHIMLVTGSSAALPTVSAS